MDILDVTHKVVEGGIEFANLDSLKNALRIMVRHNVAGRDYVARHGFANGDNIVGLTIRPIRLGGDSEFMESMFARIERIRRHDFPVHCSYDYDGEGPFFKAFVEVHRVKYGRQFVYLLDVGAFGEPRFTELVRQLRADRALLRDEVVIDLADDGERFEIDFDTVAERLAGLGFDSMTGRQLADYTMSKAPAPYGAKFLAPIHDGSVTVGFGVDVNSLGPSYDFDTRKVTWEQNGSIISGPLKAARSPDQRHHVPRLVASVSAPVEPNVEDWRNQPIVDPAIKQTVRGLALEIADAFRK